MNKKMYLQLINIIGYAGTLVVNFLANALPINNKTTGEVSNQYPNLFVPANFTFGIWGVIYLLLLIFIIYQARDLFSKNKTPMPFLDKIGWYFFFSSLANIAWIFAWHFEFVPFSLLILFLLMIALNEIYDKLEIGRQAESKGVKYFVHVPFSVYFGWITIAIFANAFAMLVNRNARWFVDYELVWTVVATIVITIITLIVLILRKDIFFSAVILWAFLGIAVKRLILDTKPNISLLITVAICWLIIAIMTGLRIKKWLTY